MSDPLASWSIPERESLKDCIRLGIWSHQLAQTALPARSVEEVDRHRHYIQEIGKELIRFFEDCANLRGFARWTSALLGEITITAFHG